MHIGRHINDTHTQVNNVWIWQYSTILAILYTMTLVKGKLLFSSVEQAVVIGPNLKFWPCPCYWRKMHHIFAQSRFEGTFGFIRHIFSKQILFDPSTFSNHSTKHKVWTMIFLEWDVPYFGSIEVQEYILICMPQIFQK